MDCLHELQHRSEQAALDSHVTDIALGATAKLIAHPPRQPLTVQDLEDDGELGPPAPRPAPREILPPTDDDKVNDMLAEAAAQICEQPRNSLDDLPF